MPAFSDDVDQPSDPFEREPERVLYNAANAKTPRLRSLLCDPAFEQYGRSANRASRVQWEGASPPNPDEMRELYTMFVLRCFDKDRKPTLIEFAEWILNGCEAH